MTFTEEHNSDNIGNKGFTLFYLHDHMKCKDRAYLEINNSINNDTTLSDLQDHTR